MAACLGGPLCVCQAKTLLVMDNCPGHGKAEELVKWVPSWLTIEFLPPNTTSMIKPMDGGVIQKLKKRYRRQLLRRLMDKEYSSVDAFKKDMDVYKAIIMTTAAWQEAGQEEIAAVWQRTLLPPFVSEEPGRPALESEPGLWVDSQALDIEINTLVGKLESLGLDGKHLEAWTSIDEGFDDEGKPGEVTIQQAVDIVQGKAGADDGEDDDADDDEGSEDGDDASEAVTAGEAMDSARKLACYLEYAGLTHSDVEFAASLRNIMLRLAEIRIARRVQTPITVDSQLSFHGVKFPLT